MKMGVAKLQPRWGSTPVISVIKRSFSLLPAAPLARRGSSSLRILMPAPIHYNTQPDMGQSKTEAYFLPEQFFVTAKPHKFTGKLLWGCTNFTTCLPVGRSHLLQCAP